MHATSETWLLVVKHSARLLFICFLPSHTHIHTQHQAKEDALRGNTVLAQQKGNMSLGLNIAAVVCAILLYVVIIGLSIGVASARSYDNSYYG